MRGDHTAFPTEADPRIQSGPGSRGMSSQPSRRGDSDLPASGLAGAAVALATGLGCFAAQWVSVSLWVPPAYLSSIWLPGGLALAAAVLTSPRQWPVVLTAAATGQTLLLRVLGLGEFPRLTILGIATALFTAGLAAVIRRAVKHPLTLDTIREFVRYLAVVVVGGTVVASFVFIAMAWGVAFRPATFEVWRTFALATVLGFLIMTPTVVLLARAARSRPETRTHPLEAMVLSVLLVLTCGLLFLQGADRTLTWPTFAVTLPPLLLWAAMRFGPLGASASLLLVTVISTLGTARGLGPFASQPLAGNTLSLQLFMLGIGVPLLGLAVVMGERNRTASALRATHLRLRRLNQELIVARETEATRIARELHDDIGQRVALVSIGLSRLRHGGPPGAGEVLDVAHLQEEINAVARSLRELTHQLHPEALEHIGLTAALEAKCDEVRRVSGLDIRTVTEGDTSAIPPDVGLCLFRVTQEGLNNVIRHAEAAMVTVTLRAEAGRVTLTIRDDGAGFTPGAPDQETGLGLLTLAERARSAGGTLAVESEPGAGTTLRVSVPLEEARDA